MKSYLDLYKRTQMFYERELGIIVNTKMIDEYIHSLTAPDYARLFSEHDPNHLLDHGNLATLGDSVLSLCICKYFYDNDSSMDKNQISLMKVRLGKNEFLNEIGEEKLHLGKYLFRTTHDLEDKKLFATTVEAIIGCIYNMNGFEKAMDFFLRYLLNNMK